ncbi:MAG: hypothetical protein IJI57_04165 [Flexilinea sp.]|nr:hypothetical protein [Flexilinea sp.]
MAGPKTYVGVSGVARQVKNIYVGVSGVARKVKKAYVGVNGVARLVYSSDFWLPTGVASSNCLAAYQFKGAASETEALSDRSGHGYTLTKNNVASGWSAASGYAVKYSNVNLGWSLNNDTLNAQSINTIIVRFSGGPTSGTCNLAWPGGSSYNRYLSSVLDLDGFASGEGRDIITSNNPVLIYSWDGNWADGGYRFYYRSGTAVGASGVVGFSDSTFYINGNAATTTSARSNWDEWATGQLDRKTLAKDSYVTLIAAAFYSVSLTAAQHKEVCTAMNQL